MVEKFIEGLQIMQTVGSIDLSADHDTVYAWPENIDDFAVASLERLEDLGWHVDEYGGGFYYYV